MVRDHTSALRHVETTFGTAPLTTRSSAATDLSELLDLDRLARGQPRPPVSIPTVDVSQWVIDHACVGASFERTDHDILRAAANHPELMARYDRRDQMRQTLLTIADRARR